MKHLFCLLFVARVVVPWGIKVTYDNVESYCIDQGLIELRLKTGKIVVVPGLFTVIEEK